MRFLALLNGLWVNEGNRQEIDEIYLRFRERRRPDRDAVYHAKKEIDHRIFDGERIECVGTRAESSV